MNNETDVEFLEELAATFSADSSFDVEDRLLAIAERLTAYEAAEKGWEMYAKERGLPARSESTGDTGGK